MSSIFANTLENILGKFNFLKQYIKDKKNSTCKFSLEILRMLLKKYLRKDQKGKVVSQKNLPNLKGQIVSKYHELFLNITFIPKPEKIVQKRKKYINIIYKYCNKNYTVTKSTY